MTESEFVTAEWVAQRYGVGRDWVYKNSKKLGAIPLGDGPKARLRFNPERVEAAISRFVPQEGRSSMDDSTKRTPRASRATVEITEDQIKNAEKRNSSHCMIAEAIKVAVPDAQYVSVDLQTIRFSDPKKGLRYTYLTPRSAQVAIITFDQGMKTEPFAFRLREGQVTQAGRKRNKAGLGPARLRTRRVSGNVPERIGGKTPPRAPVGSRRSFGLRALDL